MAQQLISESFWPSPGDSACHCRKRAQLCEMQLLYIKHRGTLGLSEPHWQPFSCFPSPLPGLNTEEHSPLFARMVTGSPASGYSGIIPISQTISAMDSHLHRWLEGKKPSSTPRGNTSVDLPGPQAADSQLTWTLITVTCQRVKGPSVVSDSVTPST